MPRRTKTISESFETLYRLERQYRHQPQELRIKALRLLKEDPSRTLKQVADLLGRSGRTLQRWWRTYRQQGLEGLLQVGQAGGKKPIKIGHNGLLQLQERLQKEGFADLKEVQHWIAECFRVDYSLSAVWYLVRVKMKAKLKTGRPKAAKQDPAAVEAFKKKGLAEVAGWRVFSQDETRFGLKAWHKRRWMAKGYRPDWVSQHGYDWFYLYGAVEPFSGRSIFWLMPDLKKESVQFFLEKLREEFQGEIALVWDRAGAHIALQDKMPEGIKPVFLPPYSPELNPIEQV